MFVPALFFSSPPVLWTHKSKVARPEFPPTPRTPKQKKPSAPSKPLQSLGQRRQSCHQVTRQVAGLDGFGFGFQDGPWLLKRLQLRNPCLPPNHRFGSKPPIRGKPISGAKQKHGPRVFDVLSPYSLDSVCRIRGSETPPWTSGRRPR